MSSILVICPAGWTSPGGVASSARRNFGQLRGGGFVVSVLARARRRRELTDAATHERVWAPGGAVVGRLTFALQTRRALGRESFDVAHIHGAESAGMLPQKRSSSPVVVTAHGTLGAAIAARASVSTPLQRLVLRVAGSVLSCLEARGLDAADTVIAVSSRVRNEIIERYGQDPSKVVVIPNSVPICFGPGGGIPVEKRVLWIGNAGAEKNFSLALETIKILRSLDSDYELHVVGIPSGPMTDGVVYGGVISPFDMPELYRNSDVTLCTSLYEADPLCVKESLACGTPVVATRLAGGALDGGGGIVVHSMNAHDLAAAVRNITSTRTARTVFAEQANQQADLFHPDREALSYLAVMRRLTNGRF